MGSHGSLSIADNKAHNAGANMLYADGHVEQVDFIYLVHEPESGRWRTPIWRAASEEDIIKEYINH